MIAAPILIGGERYVCVVGIRKNLKERRFYIHEVTLEKKLLEEAFVTNLGQNPASPKGVLQTILKNIYSVNPENVSKVVDENGKPLVVYRGAPSTNQAFFDYSQKSEKIRSEDGCQKRKSKFQSFGAYSWGQIQG